MTSDHLVFGDTLFAIRVATIADASRIWALREGLAEWMVSKGIDQWHPGERSLQAVAESIESSHVFVVEERRSLVGCVIVTWSNPFVWGKQNEPAGYIHQLMVSRDHGGQGLGSAVLAWTEDFIGTSGRALVRLDCVRSNQRLRTYYEERGYRFVRYQDFGGQPSPLLSGAVPAETALYEKAL